MTQTSTYQFLMVTRLSNQVETIIRLFYVDVVKIEDSLEELRAMLEE